MKLTKKMKMLSLAIVGLGGLALAGSAAAATCPTSAVPPWSSQSTLGGSLVISAVGLDSSACKLDASITADAAGSAYVQDDSPNAEPTYRAQFLVDTSALGSINTIQTFKLFGASTATPVDGVGDVVQLGVFGNTAGTQTFLRVLTACSGMPDGYCAAATTPLAAGNNRIEIQWVKGSGGSDPDGKLNVWVNNPDVNNPTLSIAADNGAWSGVDYDTLGIAVPSPGFRAAHLNQVVSVDTFDSRRTSFIGVPTSP